MYIRAALVKRDKKIFTAWKQTMVKYNGFAPLRGVVGVASSVEAAAVSRRHGRRVGTR